MLPRPLSWSRTEPTGFLKPHMYLEAFLPASFVLPQLQ